MGSVQSINPQLELERFFEYLYGDQEGYVYSPTKDPHTEEFEQHFFFWPAEKEQLIQHVLTLSDLYEVYYGPGLYREKDATKESFRGSNFLWAEFDGELPTSNGHEPSLRIISSVPGHEHWYWKLETFISDQDLLENVSQRLTYHLQADLSCWNANRVLRPPGTLHHESGNTVTVLQWSDHVTKLVDFADLPNLPVKLLQDTDINYIPQALEVIAKYKFEDEVFKFFTAKKVLPKAGEAKGDRSAALAKLGHYFVEMGMSNAEILSLLLNADGRWGKFAKRRDQKVRLLGIINYCRAKQAAKQPPVDQTKEVDELRVYNFEEFITSEVRLEWVVENLLHRKGFMVVAGPPDIGKSQLVIRMMQKFAMGENYLKWNIPKPIKTLFISMEMPYEELHFLMNDGMNMKSNDLLKENMLILPIGSSLKIGSKIAQQAINKILEEHRPDGVFIDSLGAAIKDELNSDKVILEAFDYVNRVIRGQFGAFVGFIHHPRKEQVGNKKPNKLDDLYGSRYISAYTTSAINLWPNGSDIEVTCLKLRMAEKFKPFKIRRTPGLDFEITDQKELGSISGPIFGNSDLEDSI